MEFQNCIVEVSHMGAVVRRLSITRAMGFDDRLGLHFIGIRLFVVGVGSLKLRNYNYFHVYVYILFIIF